MVLLITTARILSAFEAIPSSSRQNLDLPDSLALESPISHEQLIRLARHFHNERGNDNDDRSLNSLLRGTKVYVPPPPKKPEPSPEYLALKARLLAAAEADAYNRMISLSSTKSTQSPSPVFTSSSPKLSALHDSGSTTLDEDSADPLTPSLVLNIFLSVLITGFSVYWALTSFQTPEILVSSISSIWRPSSTNINKSHGNTSEPVRVLLSLFAALIVGVAEVSIYAIYLQKVYTAQAREKRIKERKEVAESDEVRGHSVSGKDDTGEMLEVGADKEEIWGRGVNGGIRRRVRERWEEKKEQVDVG